MRFYTKQHPFYCGIDLHARSMYVCLLSHDGDVLLHRNMKAAPEPLLKAIVPYREGLVVAVECMFTWYWLADLCAQEGIAFVLGHALYMKAIHGGKAKNDKIDAHKIAVLLRGGMFPLNQTTGDWHRGALADTSRVVKRLEQSARTSCAQNDDSGYPPCGASPDAGRPAAGPVWLPAGHAPAAAGCRGSDADRDCRRAVLFALQRLPGGQSVPGREPELGG